MKAIHFYLAFFLSLIPRAAVCAEAAVTPSAKDNVLQFLVDPQNDDQAYLLTDLTLQRNSGIKGGGKWAIRFDKTIFQKLTGEEPGRSYRHVKLQFSKKKEDALLLLVENSVKESKELRKHIFTSLDRGETWAPNRPRKVATEAATAAAENPLASTPGKPLPREEPAERTPIETPQGASGPSEEAAWNQTSPPSPGSPPWLRGIFDLWLEARGGGTPLTFDSYHTAVLGELAIAKGITFGFEIAATPRLYELTYRPNTRLEIRGGRISIPFDGLSGFNPPYYWGGFSSVGAFREPSARPFLPDLWSDLGVAVQYRLLEWRRLAVQGSLYVTNGFGGGVSDPAGQIGTRYPDFSRIAAVDNNSDKAIGARLSGTFSKWLTLGVSGFQSRYTEQGDVDRRIVLLGADLTVKMQATELRAGYALMQVGLPQPATDLSFLREGAYAELSRTLGPWRIAFRGSYTDADSRVQTSSDQELLGLIVSYQFKPFQFSALYFRDFKRISGKTAYDLSALRAMVVF